MNCGLYQINDADVYATVTTAVSRKTNKCQEGALLIPGCTFLSVWAWSSERHNHFCFNCFCQQENLYPLNHRQSWKPLIINLNNLQNTRIKHIYASLKRHLTFIAIHILWMGFHIFKIMNKTICCLCFDLMQVATVALGTATQEWHDPAKEENITPWLYKLPYTKCVLGC